MALVICVIGAFSSALVMHRGQVSRKSSARMIWAGLGGAVMGLGIWATHFMAMLGLRTGFTVEYDGMVTGISAVIAVIGFSITGLILINNKRIAGCVFSTFLAAASTGSMHYYGLTAVKQNALLEHDWRFVVASLAVLVAAMWLAAWFGILIKSIWKYVIGAVCVILGIVGLHFTGMAGLTIIPIRDLTASYWTLSSEMMTYLILGGMALILIAAAFASGLDSLLTQMRSREKMRLSLLAEAVSEVILVANRSLRVVELNSNAERILGDARTQIVGRSLTDLLGILQNDIPSAGERKNFNDHILKTGDGDVPVDVQLRSIRTGRETMIVASVVDLRERMKRDKHIRNLAFNDHLTGLCNRTSYQRALGKLLRSGWADSEDVSVLLIDLDEFKDINDQYGHAAGDTVLGEVARRLSQIFGPDQMVARLGGDEFAILICSDEGRASVMARAQACVDAMILPVSYGSISIDCGLSVGVAFANRKGDTIETLLKSADRALYAAKRSGRFCVREYDDELHAQNETRRSLDLALVQAVDREEFELYYQPKVCAISRDTIGYEALIRWNRPGHGMVSPKEFIEVAEEGPVIQEIGKWTLRQACMDAASWPSHISVSVNLSARQFLDPALYASVRDVLRKSGLSPKRLELEITETALIQNTHVATTVLERLSRLGVQIALDDFGTGYSSMRFVQQFPFDRIKIDRSFVSLMSSDKKAYAVIDAILRLGQNLSIPVVAEGVETEEQAQRLIAAQCTELQGYLISRPRPLSEVVKDMDVPQQRKA